MERIDLPAIEAAAKAATPGPWNSFTISTGGAGVVADGSKIAKCHLEYFEQTQCDHNAAFIATANPETVLALCAALRDAEARAKKAEAALPRWIPVGERMPGPLERVLVFFDETLILGQCHHYASGAILIQDEADGECLNANYEALWMPVPPVPKS